MFRPTGRFNRVFLYDRTYFYQTVQPMLLDALTDPMSELQHFLLEI